MQVRAAYVLDELPLHRQRLVAERRRRLALREDTVDDGVVVVLDVRGVVRRTDGGDRARLGYVRGGGDHRGTAERVADQDLHVAPRRLQEARGLGGVGDLVGEGAVAPVTLGVAEPEVVEAQHPDALRGKLLADPRRGRAVLAEREAVGEDSPAAALADR